MPTGPELGARLASTDPHDATDLELHELLSAESRQLSHQQARVWAVMAEIAHRDPTPNLVPGTRWTADRIFDSAVDEIRAELLLTRRSARRELENADGVACLPPVMNALASGLIDRTRAIVLADGCLDLTDDQRTVLLDTLLPEAARLTATRLAEKVRRVAVALDPAWAERRYKQAVHERRVIGYLNNDGSATVSGQYLPAEQAAAACARVDALADAAKRAGAAAKIDHLRAELFLGLLDGRFHGMAESAIVARLVSQFPHRQEGPTEIGEPASDTGRSTPENDVAEVGVGISRGVHLKVGLGTLLGIDEQPGEITGWGPVTASVARTIAQRQRKGEWRFAVVDGAGQLVSDGITRRRSKGPKASGPRVEGAIVELHAPRELLTDAATAAEHPTWSAVLADLAAQHAEQEPIAQDASARFAGRRLRRRTQIRFQHCVFAGCRRPASDCDLDHRHDHSRGGRTDEENLEPGCQHDHRLKTVGGWRLVRRDEHTFVWISPLGRRHVVQVEPVAPPLPAPVPRQWPADLPMPYDGLAELEPSFSPLTRRGRPLVFLTAADSGTESDPDPPPF
ncbi:MAG: hypothetical protein QOH89_2195 [Pseudonocardiales bacterium]|nr:hypothetical protein [Pseudonocardiales bacterium]